MLNNAFFGICIVYLFDTSFVFIRNWSMWCAFWWKKMIHFNFDRGIKMVLPRISSEHSFICKIFLFRWKWGIMWTQVPVAGMRLSKIIFKCLAGSFCPYNMRTYLHPWDISGTFQMSEIMFVFCLHNSLWHDCPLLLHIMSFNLMFYIISQCVVVGPFDVLLDLHVNRGGKYSELQYSYQTRNTMKLKSNLVLDIP